MGAGYRAAQQKIGALPSNVIGVIFAILSGLLVAASASVAKHITAGLPGFEVAFFRNLFGIAVMLPWFVGGGFARLKTQQFGHHALRGMAGAAGMLAWFWALGQIPLAQLISLNFSSQLFAVVLAILILGEKSVLWRWAALGVGFVGVLIIMRPGVEGISAGGIAIILSALIWSGCRVSAKVITRTDSPGTLVAWQTILLTVFTFPAALTVWVTPSTSQLVWLVLVAGLSTLAQLSINWSIKFGDLTIIEPIAYIRLVWAALIGFLVFSEVPSIFTIAGAFLIVGSVLYLLQRERREGIEVAAAARVVGP